MPDRQPINPGLRLVYIIIGDADNVLGPQGLTDYVNAVGFALNGALRSDQPDPDGLWWGRWYSGVDSRYRSACMCVQLLTPYAEAAAWQALAEVAARYGHGAIWSEAHIVGSPGDYERPDFHAAHRWAAAGPDPKARSGPRDSRDGPNGAAPAEPDRSRTGGVPQPSAGIPVVTGMMKDVYDRMGPPPGWTPDAVAEEGERHGPDGG